MWKTKQNKRFFIHNFPKEIVENFKKCLSIPFLKKVLNLPNAQIVNFINYLKFQFLN